MHVSKMRMSLVVRYALTVTVFLTIGMAQARASTVAFDNTGAGTLSTVPGLGALGVVAGLPSSLSALYTVDTTGTLSSISLWLQEWSGPPTTYMVAISEVGQTADQLGVTLDTFYITPPAYQGGSDSAFVTANSTSNPLLQAGQSYWFAVYAPQNGASGLWYAIGNTTAGDLIQYSSSGVPTYIPAGSAAIPQPSLMVTVNPVPLPSAAWMLGSGLVMLGILRRRWRFVESGLAVI
jgi:hypothetical protein